MTTGHDHDPGLPLKLAFGTPRKLPKAARLEGRVAVVDIAFASESGGRRNGFERTTLKFIDQLGERLAAWVDHHDSKHHQRFVDDPRFTLATKAEHGACPEMVTPEVVEAAGSVDTVVCHTDFDGLASAAKWMLGGHAPYEDCDDDAHAIDTRVGFPSDVGARCDRALRARPRDTAIMTDVVSLLVDRLGDGPDDPRWLRLEEAGAELVEREKEARSLAEGYRSLCADLVLVDASERAGRYDRTLLLLLGQQQATMAAVVDGDNVTFAAPYDSGVDFLERFGLSGGMPTLVSIHRPRLATALRQLDVSDATVREVLAGLDA